MEWPYPYGFGYPFDYESPILAGPVSGDDISLVQ